MCERYAPPGKEEQTSWSSPTDPLPCTPRREFAPSFGHLGKPQLSEPTALLWSFV